ncbi:MAG: protein kinase [Verrucomicrobiota bacterium]
MSQHLSIGEILKSKRGEKYRIQSHLDSGGQGSVYSANCEKTGSDVVVKTYHQGQDEALARKRIEALIRADLSSRYPGLATPTALIEKPMLAHVAPRVGEASLDELLQNGSIKSLQDRIVVAAALARQVEGLEDSDIIHGDLNPENVRIDQAPDGIQGVFLIDFDNANGKTLPVSHAFGSPLSMPPEARLAMKHKASFAPTFESDRYSLALLIHETITLRNPCQLEMNQNQPDRFFEVMEQSQWTADPANDASLHHSLGGLPSASICGSLYRLFKSGLTGRPDERPSARKWREALSATVSEVIVCPACVAESILNPGRGECHWCGTDFPMLSFEFQGKKTLIDRNGIVIGRKQLGGSNKVSTRHAIFRRIGPETFVEPIGSNPTKRVLPNGRVIDLKNGTRYALSTGDKLRLGDGELKIRSL